MIWVIHFDVNSLELKQKELEEMTLNPNFWEDAQKSNKILEDLKAVKSIITKFQKLKSEIENLFEISELIKTEYDEELAVEISHNIKEVENLLEKFEIETLLSGKYDKNNAILTIHPGAGGTEAQDWAEMLYRMYVRWANKNEYLIQELDYLEGDEAGLKSVTFEVKRRKCIWIFKRRNGST